MSKAIVQGFIVLATFAIAIFCLTQINWMKMLHVESSLQKLEESLGDRVFNSLRLDADEIHGANGALDSMLHKLCEANNLENTIELHVLHSDEVNAFALPGNKMVFYSALITEADNADEVAGVMAHELAHIKQNHVMKSLVQQFGLQFLFSAVSGNAAEAFSSVTQFLSTNAFSRDMEKEADLIGLAYLEKAKVNPAAFVNFMVKLDSIQKEEGLSLYSWLSTHPDGIDRSEYLSEKINPDKSHYESIISEETWSDMIARLNEFEK
ncbi:M48 family metallopeptidase [Sphingobacterium hungaricum]